MDRTNGARSATDGTSPRTDAGNTGETGACGARPTPLTSALLARHGFRHGFFTRAGGVSPDPFASLSFSLSVGDAPANVAENRRRAASALGVPPERLLYASQVHGATALLVGERATFDEVVLEEADALVSEAKGVACGVRTADCVPILVGDPETGAVAAVHAGWRGVVANVTASALERLGAECPALRSGAGVARLVAAIGPHISQAAFEVSDDVAELLAGTWREAGGGTSDEVLLGCGQPGARPRVDLRRLVREQLRAAGLDDARIEDVPGCTFGDPSRFFSYRRDGQRTGRHLSAIVARGR